MEDLIGDASYSLVVSGHAFYFSSVDYVFVWIILATVPPRIILVILCHIKGAQAWKFFAHIFCTKRTHLGRGLGNKTKKNYFSIWPLISIVFGFLPHTECAVNKKKNFSLAKIKSWLLLHWSPCVYLQWVFWKFDSYGTLMNVYNF